MWIEEIFGDIEINGFDLEKKILDFIRLFYSMLVFALLDVWLIYTGAWVKHVVEGHIVDTKDRRDLCIFQIGLSFH
jgi:hypothetical protein